MRFHLNRQLKIALVGAELTFYLTEHEEIVLLQLFRTTFAIRLHHHVTRDGVKNLGIVGIQQWLP